MGAIPQMRHEMAVYLSGIGDTDSVVLMNDMKINISFFRFFLISLKYFSSIPSLHLFYYPSSLYWQLIG